MKSFADIKRRFTVGAVLECVSNTYRPEVNGSRRTISKVQTNAIACHVDGSPSLFWTYFPKAKDVDVIDDNTFRFWLWKDRENSVTLRFVEAA